MNKIIILAIFVSIILVGGAKAEDAAEKLLEALAGEFRGRGEAVIELTNRQERISCKLKNTFNSEAQVLNINGVCATTQGKAEVDGKLSMVEGKVVGSFLSPFKNSEITEETSDYEDGKLILSTSLVNKGTGDLSRMRQIITRNLEGGFSSTFQKFDNSLGGYQDTGYVEFSPSGN